MDSLQPKKLLIINILDILKKYTDENHRLSQKEIAEILENEELCSYADAVILYSSVSGLGKDDLWREIASHCGL